MLDKIEIGMDKVIRILEKANIVLIRIAGMAILLIPVVRLIKNML